MFKPTNGCPIFDATMASGAALEGGWFKTVQPNKDPLLVQIVG